LSTTKLAKKLPAVGKLISVAEFKGAQLPDFVVQYAAAKNQRTMTRQTAQVLVELAGDEPGMLAGEVDKLALFTEGRKNITTADVQSLSGHNRIFDAFEVISAMTAGDTNTAITRLRNMFRGEKDAEYSVVGAFAYHFRRMFSAKAMLAKGANEGQVAGKLRIWYDKDAFFDHLRRISLAEAGSILRRLAAIDHASKSGQGAASVAIEQLIVAMGAKKAAPAVSKRR